MQLHLKIVEKYSSQNPEVLFSLIQACVCEHFGVRFV